MYRSKHTFAIFIKIPNKTYNFKLALKKQEFPWLNLWMDEFERKVDVKVGIGIGCSWSHGKLSPDGARWTRCKWSGK